MKTLPYHDIILQLIHSGNYDVDATPEAGKFLAKLKKEFASIHKLSDIPSNIQLLKEVRKMRKERKLRDEEYKQLVGFLRKRGIRSQSGIVSVQVLTKPWHCPGSCIFCPDQEGMPKSYIKSEPGAMRAALNNFDPIKQVYNRLRSLTIAGHDTDKIEMIVLGGTWDVYTKDYKIKFIKSLYDACNTFSKLKLVDSFPGAQDESRYKFKITNIKKIKYPKTLKESVKKNEKAKNRIIGLTIETRPEYVTDENCQFWRGLGVTRIEMGVQSLYDDVLKANKRGHNVEQIRQAFEKMRRYGFKISVHIMPGLYKSTYQKDLGTFKKLYSDIYLKPDEIKFYPTSVIPNTPLCRLYKKGEYKPLTTAKIKKLIKEVFLDVIPAYTRIKRLIRDIPANEIVAGSSITNLGQIMHNELQRELAGWRLSGLEKFYKRLWPELKIVPRLPRFARNDGNENIETFIVGEKPDMRTYRNFVSLDTRSREIRNKVTNPPLTPPLYPRALSLPLKAGFTLSRRGIGEDVVNLVIRRYMSSVGIEYFISFEDVFGYLYGFARLMLPQIDSRTQMADSRKKIIDDRQHISDNGVLSSKFGVLSSTVAMIRELHVYGNVEGLNDKSKNKKSVQHKGFGKQLMEVAEKIAKDSGYKKIAVISGVGVRGYYRKLGYKLKNTYMIKKL